MKESNFYSPDPKERGKIRAFADEIIDKGAIYRFLNLQDLHSIGRVQVWQIRDYLHNEFGFDEHNLEQLIPEGPPDERGHTLLIKLAIIERLHTRKINIDTSKLTNHSGEAMDKEYGF